ncbi:bifunctional RNase H/acid phosphatase [Kineococcus sp. T13]|nr:bifunctional RNase H/acid phosphatase [Kineococcus vitellinus]NAZ75649.1 bifunctional RNase H/acid phosphatase [Kineococcus vitellinus]
MRIEADGGSRGNPGPAGFGAVVKDAATGEVLAEVAASIGRATNNVAEYRGLLAGLEAAAAVDPDARVEVRMDSKLVVEQMSGRWQVKHADMRKLAQEARTAWPAGRVDYGWIPRAQNSHADRLANEAMDAAAAGRQWQRSTGSAQAAPAAPAGPAAAPVPAGPPTELVLVRAASTALTEQQLLAGRRGSDPELSERGRAEAAALAAAPEVRGAEVVLTSTMRDARQTARAVADALGVEVLADPQWDETDVGDWAGLSPAQLSERWPRDVAAWGVVPDAAAPGGESLRDVERRVLAAQRALLRRWAGRRVVLVSHADPLRVLLRAGLGLGAPLHRRLHLDPASRSLLRCAADGSADVLAVNRV